MGRPRKSYALWLAGHFLRFLFVLLITAICAAIIWRAFISDILPDEMDTLYANSTLASAYAQNGGELTPYTQEQASVTRGENNSGYFGVPRFVFIPQANQLQLTFRYNNSTLDSVRQDYALQEDLPRGVEIFDVTLVSVKDTTPQDKSDNTDGSPSLEKQRIKPVASVIDTTALYTYILYTFDGVCVDTDTIAVFLDVYYEGDVDYEKPAYGTLRLYHCESPNLPLSLSDKERRALEQFAN